MPEFIVFKKHEITGSYLYLDERKYKEIILNLKNVVYFAYKEKYPDGYGNTLSHLEINTVNGTINLYRKDADFVYNLLKEIGEYEK